MKSIVPMIIERVKSHMELLSTMGLDWSADINIGRYQENPVQSGIYLSIHPGDPQDPEYRDGVATLERFDKIGVNVPYPREIGGGTIWWRRFSLMIGCYFVRDRLEQDAAMERAYEIYGTILRHLEGLSLPALTDDFGETVVKMFVSDSTFFESGGNKQYIWRGKIHFQVLTLRSGG